MRTFDKRNRSNKPESLTIPYVTFCVQKDVKRTEKGAITFADEVAFFTFHVVDTRSRPINARCLRSLAIRDIKTDCEAALDERRKNEQHDICKNTHAYPAHPFYVYTGCGFQLGLLDPSELGAARSTSGIRDRVSTLRA